MVIADDAARELDAETEKAIRAAGGRLAVLAVGGIDEIGTLSVAGMRRTIVRISFSDRCDLTIDTEKGTVRVEFRAKLLWSGDWREGVAWWLDGLALALGLTGRVADGDACSWECTRAEVCADFIDLHVTAADRPAVQTRSKITIHDTAARIGDAPEPDEDPDVETLSIGSRASACSIVVYDKTRQVNVNRRGANAANYSAAWQAGGWKGTIGGDGRLIGPPIRRVEVRLKDRALELIDAAEDRGTVATRRNLRTPSVLMDPAALADAWRWATRDVHRLVVVACDRTGEDRTRRSRAPMDPRWSVIHAAADRLAIPDHDRALKQSRRQAEDIHHERMKRSARRIAIAIDEYAAQHGVRIDGLPARLAMVEYARAHVTAEGAIDLDSWRDRYFLANIAGRDNEIAAAREKLDLWLASARWTDAPMVRDSLRPIRGSTLEDRPRVVDDLTLSPLMKRTRGREGTRPTIVGLESDPLRSPDASPRLGAPQQETEAR